MPTPGTWHPAQLPPGVLAEADLAEGVVRYSPQLEQCPPLVVAAVVLHEVCHLRGSVTEEDADCCAADLFGRLYGEASATEVIAWWQDHRQRAVVPWMMCGR